MPLVTVFIAAFNASKYIESSIKSILSQTFTDFELIIVDDGSQDNTLDIIKSFDDPRIIIIENEINKGLIYTRNLALNFAKGTYMAIQDSDDISFPDRLAKQVNVLESFANLALVGSKALTIDEEDNLLDTNLDVINGSTLLKAQLFFENTFVHSSIMIRMSVFREINGYQTYPSAEDYDLFIRIAEKYDLDNLNEYLIYYRIHRHSFSTVQKDLMNAQLKIIKEKQLKNLGVHNIGDSIDITTLDKHNYKQYTAYFHDLVTANNRLRIYDKRTFDYLVFNKWLQHLLHSNIPFKLMKVILSPVTKLSFLNKRVLKKILK